MPQQTNTSTSSLHPSVTYVMLEAWQLTHGFKRLIFINWFIYVIIFFGLCGLVALTSLIIPLIFRGDGTFKWLGIAIPTLLFLLYLVSFTCFYFFATLLGIRRAKQLPMQLQLIIADCRAAAKPLLGILGVAFVIEVIAFYLAIIFYAIVWTHLAFCLAMVVYLLAYYFLFALLVFAMPLVVTKQIDVNTAIQNSLVAMKQHVWQIFGCGLLMSMLFGLSIITFGLGFVWTIPMLHAMNGVWFREVL